MLKRSWMEIDLNIIENNYRIFKALMSENMEVMCVVKADAYGHGDTKVALRMQSAGCRNFAVSNISEAKRLRDAGIKGQILILGYTPVSETDNLKKYDVTQALISEEYAELLADKGIKAQFAIDTGMNRIGLDADDISATEQTIRKYRDRFELTGIFSHLCVADTESENSFTKGQIEKFKAVEKSVADLNLRYIHCLNTAGGLFHEPVGNMVRLGVSLYGMKPSYENSLPDGIKTAATWKSVVSMVKTVHPGETIGYGRTFAVKKEMKIATIPTGYADGYNRLLSNKGYVLIGGKKAPVVGNVCMDQMMVDVTGMDVRFEDEVLLLSDEFNADDMAQMLNTIGYEVICDVGKRVERMYIE